ncbi:hypothetical protein H4219_001891 [Mycoemilia scoparia]|uniref:Transcription factor CBF/NF-Y/archaeal histone domain-containing protein n=1 Tax=Mycoemilia scoparia TaxID=417184 RepID=A0A9W8A703_9FUNG|nr:hypothetical protein H4219_001891 [Mycoemilia scoparia]
MADIPQQQVGSPSQVGGGVVPTGDPLQDFFNQFWETQNREIQETEPDFRSNILPLARIKKVMKSDPDVKVQMISAEAPILFSKACEIFINELTQRAWMNAEENKRRTLQRQDVSAATTKSEMFDFLIDVVPREDVINKKATSTTKEESIPQHTQASAAAAAAAAAAVGDMTGVGGNINGARVTDAIGQVSPVSANSFLGNSGVNPQLYAQQFAQFAEVLQHSHPDRAAAAAALAGQRNNYYSQFGQGQAQWTARKDDPVSMAAVAAAATSYASYGQTPTKSDVDSKIGGSIDDDESGQKEEL